MNEFVVLVEFLIQPGRSEEFRDLVTGQAEASLQEDACRHFDACFDTDDETRALLYEIYDSRSGFDAHLKTPHFLDFDQRSRLLVVSKQVSFWALSKATKRGAD